MQSEISSSLPGAKPPWSIKAYWLISVLASTGAAVRAISSGAPLAGVFGLAIAITIATAVYRRGRVAWVIAAGAPVAGLALGVSAPQPLLVVAIQAVVVMLLVSPPSLRFVWRGTLVWAGPSRSRGWRRWSGRLGPDGPNIERSPVPDATSHSDLERPAGWYIDPASPKRMKYWHADGGWNGTTKTPKTLYDQWSRDLRSADETEQA